MTHILRIVGILSLLLCIIHVESHAQETVLQADVKKSITMLQSGSLRQKINAARNLGKMGNKAAPSVPYLIELIDSPEKYESLGSRFWNTVTILGSSYEMVKDESQKALILIGKPSVQPLSNALLKHTRSSVRSNAARVLGGIKDLNSVDPLIVALKTDQDYEVRMWSAEALGKFAEIWSVDALDNAVAALIKALKDSNMNVTQKAAYALGKTKSIKVVPALIETLRISGKDSDAGLALFMITGQRFGNDPQKWQEWHDRNRTRQR